MSFDFIGYSSSEITEPDLMREDPCYPPSPPLQLNNAPPELFDQEFDNDEELSEYNLTPEQQFAFFSSSRNTSPTVSAKISNPASAFTDSTDSSSEIASSQYSFNATSSESEYLDPSEFETHGLYHDSMQTFISSAEFTNSLPYIPPLNPAEAHGTMDLNPNLTDDYSTVMHQLETVTCVDPAALSVHAISDVISDSKAQMAPVRKPFKCPHCPFSSARKHNLKTHVETHNKEASKRFGCSTCGRRFSRKHDLRRHREAIHGDRMPSSSAYSVSSRRFELRSDLPQAQYHTTTASGDERLTSSHHPGSSSATGVEGLMVCWEDATWLQGA